MKISDCHLNLMVVPILEATTATINTFWRLVFHTAVEEFWPTLEVGGGLTYDLLISSSSRL